MSSTFAGNSTRREPVTSATIQKMLDENTQLIQAVIDYQNQGEAKKCAQYQQILHRNLVFLATIADANMNIQSQMQQGSNVAGMPIMAQSKTLQNNMNANAGFRQPNMVSGLQSNIQAGMQMSNIQNEMQPMASAMPNMQGNMPNMQNSMPNIQGSYQGMQGSMQGMQGSMQGIQANMPSNVQGMQSNMQGIPANIQGMPGNMQGMQGNMQNVPANIQGGMAGNIPMQSNDMITNMQQGVPNMTVSSQNDLQTNMMMQQRTGMQAMQGMQFGGNMQQNPGGY